MIGLTLAEVAVALFIVLLLLGATTPFILRYRGRSSVDRATEVTKAALERASEEARTAGFPLPDTLKNAGLPTASAPQSTEGADLFLRVRRRLRDNTAPETILKREYTNATSVKLGFEHLGFIDLDAEPTLNGLFAEFVEVDESGTETVLATIPVDLNGEFVLHENNAQGFVAFSYGSYGRILTVSHRGTVVLDRR